jgi:hypothetical protein
MTIRTRLYESENTYEVIFTRIRIDVERVSTLVNPLAGNTTADTTKPWVGKIDSSSGTFRIVQTNGAVLLPIRLFEGNFFTIFIEGHVRHNESKNNIEVSYKLGWYTVLFFSFVYSCMTIMMANFVLQDDWNSVSSLIPSFLLYVIPILLLRFQLDRTEKKIRNLLG